MATRRERKEQRVEQRREWAEGRKEKSEELWAEHQAPHHDYAMWTQPMNPGDRGASYRQRIQRKADKAGEHSDMAQRHSSIAGHLEDELGRSVYSDDVDMNTRLTARIAENRAEVEDRKRINNLTRKMLKDRPDIKANPRSATPDDLIQAGIPERWASVLLQSAAHGSSWNLPTSTLNQAIKKDEKRITTEPDDSEDSRTLPSRVRRVNLSEMAKTVYGEPVSELQIRQDATDQGIKITTKDGTISHADAEKLVRSQADHLPLARTSALKRLKDIAYDDQAMVNAFSNLQAAADKRGATERAARVPERTSDMPTPGKATQYEWEGYYIDPSTVDAHAEYDKMTISEERTLHMTPHIQPTKPRSSILKDDPYDKTMEWVKSNRDLTAEDFAFAMAFMQAKEVARDDLGVTFETPQGVRIDYSPPGMEGGFGSPHMSTIESEHPNLQFSEAKLRRLNERGLPRRTSKGGYTKAALDKFVEQNIRSQNPAYHLWGKDTDRIVQTMDLLGAEPIGTSGDAILYQLPGGHVLNVSQVLPPEVRRKRSFSQMEPLDGKSAAEYWTERQQASKEAAKAYDEYVAAEKAGVGTANIDTSKSDAYFASMEALQSNPLGRPSRKVLPPPPASPYDFDSYMAKVGDVNSYDNIDELYMLMASAPKKMTSEQQYILLQDNRITDRIREIEEATPSTERSFGARWAAERPERSSYTKWATERRAAAYRAGTWDLVQDESGAWNAPIQDAPPPTSVVTMPSGGFRDEMVINIDELERDVFKGKSSAPLRDLANARGIHLDGNNSIPLVKANILIREYGADKRHVEMTAGAKALAYKDTDVLPERVRQIAANPPTDWWESFSASSIDEADAHLREQRGAKVIGGLMGNVAYETDDGEQFLLGKYNDKVALSHQRQRLNPEYLSIEDLGEEAGAKQEYVSWHAERVSNLQPGENMPTWAEDRAAAPTPVQSGYEWEQHFIEPESVDVQGEFDKMTLMANERDFVHTPQIERISPRSKVLKADPLTENMAWALKHRNMSAEDFAFAMAYTRAKEVDRNELFLTYETEHGVRIDYWPPLDPDSNGMVSMGMNEEEHPNLQFSQKKLGQLNSKGLPRRTSTGGYLKAPITKFFADNAKARNPRHPVWGSDYAGIERTMDLLGAEPRGYLQDAIQYELPGNHMVNIGPVTAPYVYSKSRASEPKELTTSPTEFWTEQFKSRTEEVENLRVHPTVLEWRERDKAKAEAEALALTDQDMDGIADVVDPVLTDTDNDGIADVVDPEANTPPADSDGDGIPDVIDAEPYDKTNRKMTNRQVQEIVALADQMGIYDGVTHVLTDDSGAYAKPSYFSEATGEHVLAQLRKEQDGRSVVDLAPVIDTDGDGLVDLIDPDKDGDGQTDNAIEIAIDAPELSAPMVIVTEIAPAAEPVEVVVAETTPIAYYEPKPAKAKKAKKKKGRSRADIISAAASKATKPKKKAAPKGHPFLSKAEARRR